MNSVPRGTHGRCLAGWLEDLLGLSALIPTELLPHKAEVHKCLLLDCRVARQWLLFSSAYTVSNL